MLTRMAAIKILIQDRETKLYLKSASTWTDDAEQAHLFAAAFTAFKFSQSHAMENVEVVFQPEGEPVQRIITQRTYSLTPPARKSLQYADHL